MNGLVVAVKTFINRDIDAACPALTLILLQRQAHTETGLTSVISTPVDPSSESSHHPPRPVGTWPEPNLAGLLFPCRSCCSRTANPVSAAAGLTSLPLSTCDRPALLSPSSWTLLFHHAPSATAPLLCLDSIYPSPRCCPLRSPPSPLQHVAILAPVTCATNAVEDIARGGVRAVLWKRRLTMRW